ncbi:MAG: Stp1/IreP family PP2C-type Ser/Thr phosphatase [Candidatus Accumulibacter sp.]|uniref:Stp1/IreP family PP2C-type Ser/Thr phosphatase n=1 Tax=Candidatus Accumulibacter cognatus TaxID=2954383 RepID=A0A7D5SII7_9PROT|nr:Stp1/IreP family PP2C-type Ser/Thr phosphatase [Accumulibacter sp.]MBN8516325.1 Stp1/IreP family PP2C-type Ser/Thr phosphatase [Accumulibacter sp.]MBO3712273.1 Stp1/IreP family PP2C-type Ser/Thr phosphatase [Accumulibacter sp.]QLH52518.1 MAG: Stp1/IreP family PP2C-type Ser/Thr phosphatase [Candidatus Accumulibacter cognatus]
MGVDVANSLLGALEIAARTDPGLVRGKNEDSVFADANQGLVILADGMGGYNAGEIASNMATKLLSARLVAAFKATAAYRTDSGSGLLFAHRCLKEQIAAVNLAIYQASESQSKFGGMGTTLVAAVFCDDQVVVAHIGDSRLYRLRGNEFTAMTHDHSVLQEQIDSGLISAAEARYSLQRNLVTRAVGIEAEVEAEIHVHPVRPGDVYLLCSDGLYDLVEEVEIHYALEMHAVNLECSAAKLIQMANDNGGNDNISVVVIKVLHAFPAAKRGWSKLWSWLN